MKTKTAVGLTILVMLVCAVNMVMIWQLTHVKESRTAELTATVTGVDGKTPLSTSRRTACCICRT